ncbi:MULTISPECIES: hypothetical protein [Rhizobium]|uniref:Uncharacterized protein n=4 Tax=Rhizobium TaxID=379 RepID=A0A6P1CH08_RHITR|nr:MULTISPECIES: hypothetical protein [Rhizobium]AGB73396.1 hypothetical protein RTCIAT899_PB00475 [Rhizobium tropici CIAT 899]AYG70335.1 hypothetical protein CCGE531_30170 [Rhizobium sp. CCGE531]AYG76728.1 hypothetical protein CCGE532_29735 [Rhizobium sp. CCGE532]ENN86696.1 hypothetical protein RHSP_68234 [Rhizobium freirei PRF 81]MBB4245308.1 hypothetical protein [Rhizobium tropici]
MDEAENDLRLIAVMRRYFAVRDELAGLKSALEDKRKAAGIAVGEFYHVRADNQHAKDVSRTVALRRELEFLMSLAEGWSRGDIIHLAPSAE